MALVAGLPGRALAPRTLEARRVEAAFLEIALLCQRAVRDRRVPLGVHEHFLQIACMCRRFLHR